MSEAWPIVLGTAGHIDHGKTTLVHALTGIDTDRLAVEKQRGITTELGFAHLDLGARRIAVVDVPGHERFLRSMVAGATGLDLVVLVIAADEGIMPQTREHLDVCQLLGVRRGLIAITKRDLVDDEWLEMLDAELAEFVAGGFLDGAPRVPVSARTGAGLDALRAAIAAQVDALPARSEAGVFRLPVDRVFTIKGFGSVVTGTIASGAVAVGDEVVAWPRGVASRVRGIQLHGAAAARARAGQRCALNLGGVAVEDLARGDVLAHPGALAPTHLLDVRFRHLPAARAALPVRSKVLLHHGTTQVEATLALLGGPLAPGAEGFAQLRLDRATPIAALPGDRFLVRGFTPLADHGSTLGGGEIVRVQTTRARPGDHAALVERFAAARADERVAVEIRAFHAAAPSVDELSRRTGRSTAELAAPLARLTAAGAIVLAGDVYLHAEVAAALEATARGLLDAARELPREELRQRLPAALPHRAFDVVLDAMVRRGAVELAGELVRLPAPRAPTRSPLETELLARFAAWALEPPRPREVAAAIGRPEPAVKQALDALLASRALTKVKPDYYVETAALAALEAKLRAHLGAHPELTPQDWKELTGTSRKFSIPLAEHFDAQKVTLRVGDNRRLRQK